MDPTTISAYPIPLIDARFAFIPQLHSWDDRSLLCQPAVFDGQVQAARRLSRGTAGKTATKH